MPEINYEKVLDDFFSDTRKRLQDGSFRDIDFDCSVSKGQGRFLHDLIRELKPADALEIGLAWGGSAVHIACAILLNGSGRHTAIDPLQEVVWSNVALSEMARLDLTRSFHFVDARSDLALPKMLDEGRRFQFIFIDGDHRFDGAFVDWHFSQQLLDEGGLIVFDDAGSEPLKVIVSFIKTNFKNMKFETMFDGRFAVFRKLGPDQRGDGDNFPFCIMPES